MTWYRIQDAARDPQALLDPARWVSSTWQPREATCPACHGYGPGWDEGCDTCQARGTVTEGPRRGVSVCRTVRELAAYAEGARMDLRGCVMIELEGSASDDEDHDPGAELVFPARVVSVVPVCEVPELAGQLAWDRASR
jgi:hypothetical protein